MAIPDHVTKFREQYRAREIGRLYSGWAHFAFTTTGALAAIAFAVSRVHDVATWEWLALPVTFLIANLGEYGGHRGPMHRPRAGMKILYERHTLSHHHFYTHDAMAAESHRDFHMVLFPPVMLFFFLGVLATPVGAALYFLVSPNVGWFFAIVAVSYFLTYEWLHFAYHLPETSWVARLPGMAALRRHHTRHHDQSLMGKWNFNITFPISDLVFGTYFKDHTPSA